MKIPPFAIERYYAEHEFAVPYMLSSSDCEAVSVQYLLDLASIETRESWKKLTLGYTESQGHPELRSLIADLYTTVEKENVIVAAPEECIFLTMHALLQAGDHIVTMFPAYQSLYEIANSIGCKVSKWEPENDHPWLFDLESLEKSLRPNTILVVVNFPHNPTGYLPSKDDFQQLAEILRDRGIHLFSDEIFRYLEYEPSDMLPSASDLYENAIVLGGLSKAFGMPGARIGWLASQNIDVIRQISTLKDYTTICNSAPSEVLGIMALQNKSVLVDSAVKRLIRNLEILDQFMASHIDQFKWHRPQAGPVCFTRLKGDQSAAEFCDTIVKNTGVLLVPANIFHFGDRHVRIGFGRENLPEVLNRFDAYLTR